MHRLTRRDFGRIGGGAALGALMGGTVPAFGAVAPPAHVFDILPYVHPELRGAVKTIQSWTDQPVDTHTLPGIRTHMPVAAPLPAPAPPCTERSITGPAGAPEVRIFLVDPPAANTPRAALRPAILHMHGGGFILGSARASLRHLQEMAQALDCLIVTVDYRLAPETRFPGALEDNYAALKWLHDNAAHLEVDPHRIAVMGESAGGGHAAMLAIAARDRGEIPLAYQALIYPMLDDRTGSSVQKPPYMGALSWTPVRNRFGWESLLGVPAGAVHVPYGAVPARVGNLKGLPPAFIGVGSIDLFVDEDIDYARRLVDSGVAAQLMVVPGAFHGFDEVQTASISRQFQEALLAALREALKPPA